MRYVILRDDDTNALTPAQCLEQLYRPFLDRGLPVNLAVIPAVTTDAVRPDGKSEGFLFGCAGRETRQVPISSNEELVSYLRDNPGYHVVQHGFHHDRFEFDSPDVNEIRRRLKRGLLLLLQAGFPPPRTFVAPHDRFSPASLLEVARHYQVLSTGWFELRRLPVAWWPRYMFKKALGRSHWRIGRTALLSHPGCLLSHQRNYDTMLDDIRRVVQNRHLTVLVTHWWEYFPEQGPDTAFIENLHRTAEWLADQPDVKVVTFDDLALGKVPLN